MKKILAMLLALMMALSCTGTLAEEAAPITAYGYVSLNEELVPILMTMTGMEMDEATQEILPTIISIINNLGFYIVAGETSAQFALTLKDTPVLSVIGAQDEKGIALVSDLFPSYALTVSQETLDELLQSMTASMPLLDEAAMEAAVAGHVENLGNALSAYVGDPIPGEYTVEEGVTFNCQIPLNITFAELAALMIDTCKALMADPALAHAFALAFQEEEISPEDLDSALASLTAEPAILPDLNAALYANMDAAGQLGDDYYCTVDLSDEEMRLALMLGAANEMATLTLMAGDAAYATSEDLVSAAVNGTGEAVVIDLIMAPGESETDMIMGLDVYAQGLYVGLYAETLMEEGAFSAYSELYFMDQENPLYSMELGLIPQGEDVPLTLPEETLTISVEELMMDIEGTASTPLLMDIMSYGLSNIMANASAAMPDEINALLSLLYAPMPIEETTETETVVGQ